MLTDINNSTKRNLRSDTLQIGNPNKKILFFFYFDFRDFVWISGCLFGFPRHPTLMANKLMIFFKKLCLYQ
jgi:hypothetical protein